MPDQATKSTPGAATSKYTAQEVIDMFAELGLPVCDEGDAIKQKFESKRAHYLKCRRDPTLSVREKGTAGIQNGEAMLSKRPELLQVVYEHYASLANTALSAAVASGVTTLTPILRDNLRTLARTACRVDDKLADRFLVDYMQEKGLEENKVFVWPSSVENLAAISGPGKISLSWVLPAENCDEIEIVRELEPPPADTVEAEKLVVYRGRDASFVDGDVTPGAWYTYRVHSILSGVEGLDVVTRAVCLGEVRQASAAWQDGHIHLAWEPPGANVSVVILRRSDGVPSMRMGPGGPEPVESSAQRVHSGGGVSWNDSGDVIEGATYHYRIVADFGQGLFTEGVIVQASVPKPPPAVSALSAAYRHTDEADTVVLEWPSVASDVPVDYVVVRREGDAPAGHVEDGLVVKTTPQTRCLDEQLSPGHRYTYAVFTCAGGLYSRTGAAALPVDILAEVSQLVVRVQDRTVELEWHTPPNVSEVLVRRSLNPPRDHTDGTPVKLTGAGYAKDEDLHNGQRYHYLVCCLYRPGGGAEVVSPGQRATAVPERLPDPIEDLKVQAQGSEVLCTWTPPAHGQAVIVRAADVLKFAYGDRPSADEVSALGERIVTTGEGRALDTCPDVDKPYYTPFTITGSHAVVGNVCAIVVVPDVTDLRVSTTQDGVTLRWTWPARCKTVRVVRRADDWPTSPHDQAAVCFHYTQVEYKVAGDKFVDKMEGQDKFYYVVYAQISGVAGQFFASGVEPGCRAVVQWKRWMSMRYSLSCPSRGPHKGKEISLTWSVEQPLQDWAGFVLVASQDGVPLAPDDGVEIYRWTPGIDPVEGTHQAWVSLAPVQQNRWARFFCKAMPLDPAQRHAMLIIHPNVCVPISNTGEIESSRTSRVTRRYHAGVPRTVICPSCFEEFPVEKMLFDSHGGGEAVTARYTPLHRLLRLPLATPRNKRGQLLTRKLCPRDQNHILPFTAGVQESLIIGIIGAKYSGKSHYIAALVQRLEGQVGADLQVALLPVTDETQKRYRDEFYNPLFGKRLELPMTVGTPPPLIYDLTLDGKLWNEKRNRAVTLALYDTAGENLQDSNTARQMVDYLRVASGIIFLVDPLQVPAVREILPPSVHPPLLDHDAAPHQIIANVLQLLENGAVISANVPLSVPVAVVLTKCDVLRDAGLVDTNRLWNTDKRHIGYFDREAHEDMDGTMGEYFQRWSTAAYSNIQRRFSHYAFFGVSATGCAADQATRRYKYVSPWRVEDPLLWLLAELGIIPTR